MDYLCQYDHCYSPKVNDIGCVNHGRVCIAPECENLIPLNDDEPYCWEHYRKYVKIAPHERCGYKGWCNKKKVTEVGCVRHARKCQEPGCIIQLSHLDYCYNHWPYCRIDGLTCRNFPEPNSEKCQKHRNFINHEDLHPERCIDEW